MKYLKLFEGQKEREELGELIPELDELCQDLKDHGFIIKHNVIDDETFFNSSLSFLSANNSKYLNKNLIVDGLWLEITKLSHTIYQSFYIDDIKNDLLFIESYTEGELSLKINYYSYRDSKYDNYYCENIKDLPNDEPIYRIYISFIKA